MADFRKLVPRFWSDARIAGDGKNFKPLTTEQKLFFAFMITSNTACGQTETGIFEMMRGEMAFGSGIEIEKIHDILDFFNTQRPSLLEYDEKSHLVSIKSFFKYNAPDYLTTPEKMASAVLKDFKKTGEKCPKFWGEFAILNQKLLRNCYKGLDGGKPREVKLRSGLDQIFVLEKQLSPSPKTVTIEQIEQLHRKLLSNSLS